MIRCFFLVLVVIPEFHAFVLHHGIHLKMPISAHLSHRIRWLFLAALDADDDLPDSNRQEMDDSQPISMEAALEHLMNVNSDPGPTEDQSSGSSTKKPITNQLENLVAKLESIVVDSEGPEALLQKDGDAPFLDPETYENYRENINMDGSLSPSSQGIAPSKPAFSNDEIKMKGFAISAPDLPDSYYTTDTTSKSDAALLETLIQTKSRSIEDQDEDLHRRIMAEEGEFERQSETFQEYLQTGTSESGAEAAFLIRKERQREEQNKILLNLEKEMMDLEQTLDEKEQVNDLKVIVCSSCNLPLTQFEINSGKKGGMCQICYGQDIAARSDMRFLDVPTNNDAPSFTRAKSYRNNLSKSSRPTSKVRSPTYNQQAVNQTPSGAKSSFSSSMTPVNSDSDVKQLKMRIAALQQQVQKYKRKTDELEEEKKEVTERNIQLRTQVSQLEDELLQRRRSEEVNSRNEGDIDGPWIEVKDPDTGDLFFWNEETDEMKWEM